MTPVKNFASWFVRNAVRLSRAIDAGSLSAETAREISEHIASIEPKMRWEIGPHGDGLLFAFGCSGRRDVLELSRKVVDDMPQIPGWTFLAGKPAKDARRLLRLQRKAGLLEVDFEGWSFKAEETDHGRFAVSFRLEPKPTNLSDTELEGLAWTVLEFELGEEATLELVESVRIIEDAGQPMSALRERLTSP